MPELVEKYLKGVRWALLASLFFWWWVLGVLFRFLGVFLGFFGRILGCFWGGDRIHYFIFRRHATEFVVSN